MRENSFLTSLIVPFIAPAKGIVFFIFLIVIFLTMSGVAPAEAQNQNVIEFAQKILLFSTDEKLASLVFGMFMGVMLTASAYLFFIWLVMHDRGQAFLMLLLLCLSANIADTNDLLMHQLGFNTDTARMLLANYSLIFSCIFSAAFTYYFLEVDINIPLFRIPMLLISSFLLMLVFYSAFDQTSVGFVLPTLGVLTTSIVLVIGLICLNKGVSGSVTHIISFLFFLLGMLANPLYDLGYLPNPNLSYTLAYMSFALAALMFATVTASQFAARQEEKERELAISNDRFNLATRGANEGLFDWDLIAGEVFFSDQFRKILGQRLENKIQSLKTWVRMMQPSDRKIVREALRRFRRNAGINTINVEYRVILSNDNRRWLHTKAVAMRDATSKKIVRLVGSTSDVTARKQNEVALRASETRFRSITEAHPVPVMIVGLSYGTVLYASPSAELLLGSSQNILLQQTFDRFLSDENALTEIWEMMSKGKEINLKEVKLTRGDQSKLDIALSARKINYQNQDAMVIGLYDLTERKQAEAQIARQQEALQQSEKMAALGGLLAGVAHELNNPLSVVVGQATLLIEGSPEPKVVARAEKIYKAADRCSRIVKSFLALARRKSPERKPMDLNAIITGSLELLGYQIRTGNIEVSLELENKLPEVSGDADQMTQVITNLVLNATQALQAWTGQRRITIRTMSDKEGHVFVMVVDSGPGVPPEIRTRIFEPFFTTKGNTGGTGVGLSLCLNIVASHEGQVTVEDTPGGGATFLITLPVSTSVSYATPDQSQITTVLPHKLRVLVVDDEVELAQTLAELLEPEGLDVDIAANGAIALEKLHKREFDVIVSDLRMPVLDGPGLYEALGRELPSYISKIIYVTGDTLSTHVQTFLKQHPVPVIEKPYRVSDVRHAIDALIKGDKIDNKDVRKTS